jgi:hypothetical protein
MSLLLLALPVALAQSAPTPPPADKPQPTVKVGGVVFAHYGYDLTEGADGYNSFDLDRAYLTARAELTPHLATRLTLDADRLKPVDVAGTDTTVDTKLRVFVKHAYLEWKDAGPGVKLRFGMADTAWAPYYDQFWGHRYVAKHAADDAKLIDTSDLGIQVMGEHGKGLVSWQAGLINGEGYGKVEVDASKTAQARLTVDPLGPNADFDLPISGFVSQSFLGEADPVTMYAGAVGFKMKYGLAWAEYFGRSSGGASARVVSVTVAPKVPKVLEVLARVDLVDGDTAKADDGSTKLIVGVGHDFFERVSAMATYERTTAEAAPDAPTHGVFLRMQAGF